MTWHELICSNTSDLVESLELTKFYVCECAKNQNTKLNAKGTYSYLLLHVKNVQWVINKGDFSSILFSHLWSSFEYTFSTANIYTKLHCFTTYTFPLHVAYKQSAVICIFTPNIIKLFFTGQYMLSDFFLQDFDHDKDIQHYTANSTKYKCLHVCDNIIVCIFIHN